MAGKLTKWSHFFGMEPLHFLKDKKSQVMKNSILIDVFIFLTSIYPKEYTHNIMISIRY